MTDPTLVGFLETETTGTLAPAERIADRYEVLGLLGVGGMGSVYRVRDLALDEVVALKLLRVEDAGRLRQEVKLARRVTHPNVVRTFDLYESDDVRFLTMELVEGRSLARAIAEDGALPAPLALHVVGALCAGVGAAHAAGVLHRDLKPDNVLLGANGPDGLPRVAVTDFGIARSAAERGGAIVGTPAYMAPEAVRGEAVDARSDVYAVGAILFEVVTGRRAWPGSDPLAVANARLSAPPPDPRHHARVPDVLAAVVLRCMAPRPADRFASAGAVADALGGVSGGPVHTPTSPLPKLRLDVPVATARTVAVLPFRADPADADVAEGLTEEVIDALGATRGLRTRPFSAVARLGQSDPLEAGRALGVDVVVDGSLRRAGDTVRVAVRVLSVADGFQVRSERVSCAPSDVLSVADRLARAVADALEVDLAPAERAPVDPIAADLYLRGRVEMRRGWDVGVAPALALLAQARWRAPDDPILLATWATARARQGFYSGELGHDLAPDALADATSAAERAVSAAPDRGEPWLALAHARLYGFDVPGAAAALQLALARAPGLARAHELLGGLLIEAGRLDDGIARLEVALSLDPGSTHARMDLSRAHALAGRWDQAHALVDVPPTDLVPYFMGLIMRVRLAVWQNAPAPPDIPPELDGLPPQAREVVRRMHIAAEVLAGRPLAPDHREHLLRSLRQGNPRLRAARCQLSVECLSRGGALDAAFDALAAGVEAGLGDVSWTDACPALEPMRGDARWLPLRRSVAAAAARVVAAVEVT